MFWRISNLSASSPVDVLLDKDSVDLEELLDEDGIVQECKALNSRLINFLRDRAQVEQLLRYIVCDSSDATDSRRTFKFPFIASEIFGCEIDVILRTLVEDEELMNLLFSFLDPSRPHNSLLAGYFGKVVSCLMLRKTKPFMSYMQEHDHVLKQLIDSMGVKSITEVLVRIVGADDHMYPNFNEAMEWLSDADFLEMVIDKLSPLYPSEVHANVGEVIWVISRNAPSPLATKLLSPSIVSRVLNFALEYSKSKSSLIHSLSVIISILDPKRSLPKSSVYLSRSQQLYESHIPVDSEAVTVVLSKLDPLLSLLHTSLDDYSLPTTYGELRPPLGRHRLKIVELIEVLLGSGHEAVYRVLIESGAVGKIIDLFLLYPFNNALHHLVERALTSCWMISDSHLIDHLFSDCDIINKFLSIDKAPSLNGAEAAASNPTISAAGKSSPRLGNIGHVTRIANKILQMSSRNDKILSYIQENKEWVEWQLDVLQERNSIENVYRWACGRPSTLQDKMRDSDDDELHERDYDVSSLANNLSNALRYNIYETDDADEIQGSLDQDEEDVYFDDESAQVVVSTLRLRDDLQESSSPFTNSNWFAFKEDRFTEHLRVTGDENGNGNDNGVIGDVGDSDEDEVVIGNMEIVDHGESTPLRNEEDVGTFGFEVPVTAGDDLFDDQQLPDWVGWHQPSDIHLDNRGPIPDVGLQNNGRDCGHDHDGDVHDVCDQQSRKVELGGPAGGDGPRLVDFGEMKYWRVEQEAGLVVNK